MISFVIFDFDGVFTDGNIQFLNNQIIKTYNVKDGMGIRLLKKAGIHIGVLSGYKNNESQKKILEHFDISFVKLNCDNKLKVLNDWCNQLNLPLNQVAYMGDDLNDLSIMKQVGLTGSPLDACDEVKNISNFISIKKGGKGCVRDFCEYIIKKNSKKISTPKINIQQLEKKIFIFCGPNVIESEEHTYNLAKKLKNIFMNYDVDFIFKVSFDKANRTSINSYRGVGFQEGLRILKRIKDELHLKIITDIHEPWQAKPISEIVDVIQIPAFLCRQTDLLKAAAETGKIIHVKKGQSFSADVMHKCKEKIIGFGNPNVILCERGSMYGYQDLVVDPRNLIWLKSETNKVSMDITHCLQRPAQKVSDGTVKAGGLRELVPYMGKMAVALGVDGIFLEVHEKPEEALCDAPTQWKLDKLEWLLDYISISKRKTIIYKSLNSNNYPNIKNDIHSEINAFVCIRLNNTRLPNKNVLPLNGKPLCYWIFDKLKYVKGIKNIYVYCSTNEIMKYLPDGIKFIKRDPFYDGNDIKANELLKSFAKIIKSKYYLLCHATCPFLKISTISNLINNFDESKNDSAFTCKMHKTFLWDNDKPLNFSLNNIPRTQDMKPFYIENVGAYLYSYNEIIKNNRRVGKNPMLVNVSDLECVDIDYKEDYDYACQIQNTLQSTYDIIY